MVPQYSWFALLIPFLFSALVRADTNVSTEKSDPAGSVQRRLKRLTGFGNRPKDNDFGDPSTPDLSEPGVVRIYTTNSFILEWRDTKTEKATTRFLRGVSPTLHTLKIVDTDGVTELDAWDPTIETFPNGQKILYAGVMTPNIGAAEAIWPDDNWRRRVSAFEYDNSSDRWVRVLDSVFGDAPDDFTWLGHSYGHHLLADTDGTPWMFYEAVSEEENGQPWVTEIFATPLTDPLFATSEPTSILTVHDKDWPAVTRGFGGKLVEGPRPFRVGDWYLVGFSAGDYTSDNYGIHLMASQSIDGPYQPYLNKAKTDLVDFGKSIEQKIPLTWGAARPAFFAIDGKWWVLFHGIDQSDEEQVETGQRDVYLAPVSVDMSVGQPPKIRIYY